MFVFFVFIVLSYLATFASAVDTKTSSNHIYVNIVVWKFNKMTYIYPFSTLNAPPHFNYMEKRLNKVIIQDLPDLDYSCVVKNP